MIEGEKMMKGRKEMNEMVWYDLWQEMQQPTIKIEEKVLHYPWKRLTRESLLRKLPTNPVLVPILGRVVLDLLLCRSPLVLLLQNKLEHLMMPSLGLSFSSFPAGDLVSRESQKTREFGVEEGNF